jgi:hypothetical protein
MASIAPPARAEAPAPVGPWNPGIESQIPDALREYSTIFRPDNVFTSLTRADELQDLTGLDIADLVAFRPQRLALHELLIRVTADLSVPDGTKIEDLGINFRQMTRSIHARYILPRSDEIDALYASVRAELSALIGTETSMLLDPSLPPHPADDERSTPGLLAFLRRRRPARRIEAPDPDRESRIVRQWDDKAHNAQDSMQRAAYRALAKVMSALLVRHGRVWGGHELLASLATDMACNECASERIGALVHGCVRQAVDQENYILLPAQDEPVVMNTKGASASGKSTLRPLQKRLAGEIGVAWSDFALISPDIWRKQLIDYESLGPVYKYGGAFSGDELRIVDQKLDRYMACKAEAGRISHLLIDRFRFDSFARDSEEAGSNLLTRFGNIVYLFFMITPPESLVERAWARGLEVGRYKAVDDTLAHSVEAYSGMPEVFFTWAQRTDKRVHYEFLDNSVAQGTPPRTVAFGWNDELNILDVRCMLDVCRFRRVDVDAKSATCLYPAAAQDADDAAFLRDCIARLRDVRFAEQATGRVYLRVASGVPTWCDRELLASAMSDPDTRKALGHFLPPALGDAIPTSREIAYLPEVSGGRVRRTLGSWGRRP